MDKLETSSKNTDRFFKTTVLFIILGAYASPTFAYLDPGTGSILLQGIIASVAAVLAAGGVFWHRIKSMFLSIFSSQDSPINDSESEQTD